MTTTAIILFFLMASTVFAAGWEPYDELARPEKWDMPKPGESLMFAGTDPGGTNVDSGNVLRIEPEGASFQEGDWVLAEMEGPGCITRIWVTGKNKDNKGPRLYGRVKVYIDSKDTPAVDLPIEEFFGKVSPFIPPLATPTSGGFINCVPMPFSTYCKVVVTDHQDQFAHRTNGLGQTIPHLYHQICWRKLPEGTEVEPFRMKLSEERRQLINEAAQKLLPQPVLVDVKMSYIKPGERREVFSDSGAGVVEEFTLVSSNQDKLWLTMYWDGEDKPAVDVPARWFFAGGPDAQRFSSLPFSTDGTTSTCKFPMPYASGAKIYLENRSDAAVNAGVSVKTSDKSDSRPMRFHASYIDTYLEANTPDLVVLDVQDGPGHFVGCALTLPHCFLEGNESFFVDGREAQWVGTGTEDYFSGGWYFCFGPYDHAFSGCTQKGDFVSSYRFHLLDAVPYGKSLKMSLQHGGVNEEEGQARGVVYWYNVGK